MDRYKQILEFITIKKLVVGGRLADKNDSEEVIIDKWLGWLEKNKEFRTKIGSLNEHNLKWFNEYIDKILTQYINLDNNDVGFLSINSLKPLIDKFLIDVANNEKLEYENQKKKLTPICFNDFLKVEDKKEYYVKKMFAKGTLNMIYSPPASMKSFISYYLGLCLATGEKFFNQDVKRVNVGYFDWENPLSDIQNRVKGICEGMDLDTNIIDNFYFFQKQPTLLRVQSNNSYILEDIREELLQFIKEHNIKVLFFDTLRRLGNFDENDSGAINTIKSELFDVLIKETNVCIIFLHHTSKEGKTYRGSVDIEGILDTAFTIIKKEQEDTIKITIKNTKRRNNELLEVKGLVEIENEEFEDEDGDFLERITFVKFIQLEETEETDKPDYATYRDWFINNLVIGIRYKNKDLSDFLSYNFGISSSKTTNNIIKWLNKINILKSFGERKSKYYILNPEYAEREDRLKIKTFEDNLIKMFLDNEMIEIDLLKNKFEEKYFSILFDKWMGKGWINNAKAGYLLRTELFLSENLTEKLNVEETKV